MASQAVAETGARRLKSEERIAEVLRLRMQGMSERKIAVKVGISKSQIHRDLVKGLEAARKRRMDLAEGLIDLELMKLDALEEEVWKMIEGASENVVVPAIAEGRRISESRRKLLGLDAAEKVEHSGDLVINLRSVDMGVPDE